MLPGDWRPTAFSSEAQRATYLHDNDLNGLPFDLAGFLDFYSRREERIRQRLLSTLGVIELS